MALSALSAAFLAILAVCVTMPFVYNFVSHIQLQTKRDLEICKVISIILRKD